MLDDWKVQAILALTAACNYVIYRVGRRIEEYIVHPTTPFSVLIFVLPQFTPKSNHTAIFFCLVKFIGASEDALCLILRGCSHILAVRSCREEVLCALHRLDGSLYIRKWSPWLLGGRRLFVLLYVVPSLYIHLLFLLSLFPCLYSLSFCECGMIRIVPLPAIWALHIHVWSVDTPVGSLARDRIRNLWLLRKRRSAAGRGRGNDDDVSPHL